MPAILSARVSASCGSGTGIFTVSLINYPTGDTVTVSMASGSITHTVMFSPGNYGTQSVYGVANDIYGVSVSSTTQGSGTIYINSGSSPSLDKEIGIYCGDPEPGGGTCTVLINGVTVDEEGETATVEASGTGTLEYSLNDGSYQFSNVFSVTPGIHSVTVRVVGEAGCMAVSSFVVTEPEVTSVTPPPRDWLPASLPILYSFQSPDETPEILTINVEISTNGSDFEGAISAGVLAILPNASGQYTVNIAPYLEATFSPGIPAFSNDLKLFRLYRLAVGKASVYDGVTGEPELYTPTQHCLYASELMPIISGKITLSQIPYGFHNASYPGIKTEVDVVAGTLTNSSVPYVGLEACPKNPMHLYWLNRSGGWQSWVFDGKHEYEDEVGEGETWQDEYGRTHTASVGPVVSRVNVFSGHVKQADFSTVHSVRSAIKVYHRDGNNWREIIPERGTFPKYKAGDKRREVNFSFAYSEPLLIQHA